MSVSLLKGIIKMMLQFNFVLSFTIAFGKNNDTTFISRHPIYTPAVSNIESLKESVAPLMKISLKELITEVPENAGIFFIGCPNCNSGAQEMNVLGWKPGMGSKVRCNYCGMEFPNKKFPNNRERVITAPGGVLQVYRYYEDSSGHRYYFEAHAWYERWLWISPMAENLAKIWYLTKDNDYGDRAAAIAGRFAQVFPGYAIRYDYPNAQVQFFPANQKWPYGGLSPYRGAKWSWWGYMGIPVKLANAYDILMSGYDWKRMDKVIGSETDKRIVRDLLRLGYEFTTANPETYTNMSPGMYADMVRVGRILGDPSMVHEAVKRFREFFLKGFFADGWWNEGTTSYHNQTIGELKTVVDALKWYVDPGGWKGERFDNLDLTVRIPLYQKALNVTHDAMLPNGRVLPINDTWARERGHGGNTGSTVSHLWPSLGDAILSAGDGENQMMLNVNWSGNYGHSHYDNGSIILYAAGQELLSDIGYTHSKYRGWATCTASHNTVVIDQKGQDVGSIKKQVTGRLKFYDDKDTHVKVVDVDASPAYSIADVYRRRLVMVHVGPGRDYVVDRFDVKGGQVHDWFLHGMCEQEGTLQTSIVLDRSLETLVPQWGGKEIPQKQSDADPKSFQAYSYMQNIKAGSVKESWSATWLYDSCGLRSHILSQSETEAFRFRSPSVRLAKEDDNKLDDYMSNGIMQRHSGGASTFIAVHEPFRLAPWIDAVQMDGKIIVVRYKLNEVKIEDHITMNDNEVAVTSSAGWNYESGTTVSGEVKSLAHEGGKWSLLLDKEVPKVNYVRLDFSDGGTYYCPVAAVHENSLELVDDTGFTLDENGKVQFYTFPQNQYNGPLHYNLFVSKKIN
jgi:hypothetical protein